MVACVTATRVVACKPVFRPRLAFALLLPSSPPPSSPSFLLSFLSPPLLPSSMSQEDDGGPQWRTAANAFLCPCIRCENCGCLMHARNFLLYRTRLWAGGEAAEPSGRRPGTPTTVMRAAMVTPEGEGAAPTLAERARTRMRTGLLLLLCVCFCSRSHRLFGDRNADVSLVK